MSYRMTHMEPAPDALGIWLAGKLSAVAARVYPDGHW
jgi:hypothetical protein